MAEPLTEFCRARRSLGTRRGEREEGGTDMSRTTLSVLTAAALVVVSLSMMIARHHVMGADVKVPTDPGTWKVTLVVQGRMTGEGRLFTATPLDFGRQHIVRETC